MISLFVEHLQRISCGISVIMARPRASTGQTGAKRARKGRAGGRKAPKSLALGVWAGCCGPFQVGAARFLLLSPCAPAVAGGSGAGRWRRRGGGGAGGRRRGAAARVAGGGGAGGGGGARVDAHPRIDAPPQGRRPTQGNLGPFR